MEQKNIVEHTTTTRYYVKGRDGTFVETIEPAYIHYQNDIDLAMGFDELETAQLLLKLSNLMAEQPHIIVSKTITTEIKEIK